MLDASIGWIVGGNGTILHTTDGGTGWTQQSSHTAYGLHGVSFLNASFGLAVGEGGTILRTMDGGANWQVIRTDWMDILRAVHVVDGQYAYAAGTNAIFQPFTARSTDGGLTWAFGSFYIQNNEGGLTDVRFTDAQKGFASAYLWDGRGAVCRTPDGGVTWSAVTVVGFALYGIDFPSPQVGMAAGLDGNVLRSTNGGLNWSFQWVGLGRDLYAVSFADEATGWVVGEAGWIARTTDGGAHWTQQAGGTSPVLQGVDCVSSLVGTVVGEAATILRTTSGGADPAGLPVAAAVRPKLSVSPNPFARETAVRLTGLAPGSTSVIIRDIAGRRVRGIVVPAEEQLTREVLWDGRDDRGKRVAVGAYFVTVVGVSAPAQRVVKIE